ncbi:phage terminase large subunit [Campylobacter jejuni]|nr:phage terminase large subunit [Campylobacter jejuni]ELV5447918.1 phage terminase large subunit [Campylobacter jejuni]
MNLDLQVNEAFKILYTPDLSKYREVVYYGGRGGAKTFEMVQFLGVKAISEKCNILCLREFSNKNKNSLVSAFREFFETHNIETALREYTILGKKETAIKISIEEISFKHNGSRIIFAGINDNTVMSLKSISNINYCWVEEANFLTDYSYNILKPTIRAKNSKIFYTFNPQNKDDYLYIKTKIQDDLCLVKKVNWSDNPFFPEVLNQDRINNLKTMPRDMYLHVWEGEPLEYNDSQVINTDLIGYFNDNEKINYNETFLTADTAYSKKESADFSVIGCFGKINNEIHLLRIFKGKWEFNELQNILISAYEWTSINHRAPRYVFIEKKASGMSLLQELQRTTHLPLKEVTPKTDKYSRVSDVLSELSRLKLPLNKTNPINSWIEGFLNELKMFRSDLKHEHDDQVDVLCYALQYCKNAKVDWNMIATLARRI